MGLLALHGSWVDVVAANGSPITVTRVRDTNDVDGGVYADELKAMVDQGSLTGLCRVVERGADGVDFVVGKSGKGLAIDKKTKLFRNLQITALCGVNQPGLVLQVPDGVVQPLGKVDNTMERKLLSIDLGLKSFDVSLAYALLMDTSHQLLGERTDFVDLRTALDAIKNDRNELVGHEGCVTAAEYAKAIANIHAFVDACVVKHALFDAMWKQQLHDAVVNACNATYTVKDLEIVCRDAKDYVERSHREAKTLCHAQVPLDTVLFHISTFMCSP